MASSRVFCLLVVSSLAAAQLPVGGGAVGGLLGGGNSSLLGNLLSPLNGVETDVKGAVTAVESLLNGTQNLGPALTETLEHVNDILSHVLLTVTRLLGLPDSIVTTLLNDVLGLETQLLQIIDTLGKVLASEESLPDGVEGIIQQVIALLQDAVNTLRNLLQNLLGNLGGILNGSNGGLLGTLLGPNGLLGGLLGGGVGGGNAGGVLGLPL